MGQGWGSLLRSKYSAVLITEWVLKCIVMAETTWFLSRSTLQVARRGFLTLWGSSVWQGFFILQGPKSFILEECQKARKLRSCSSRGLQVQNYCVVPLNLFFFPGDKALNGVRTVQPVTKRQLHLPFSSEGSPVCHGNYASQPPWPGSILHVNW